MGQSTAPQEASPAPALPRLLTGCLEERAAPASPACALTKRPLSQPPQNRPPAAAHPLPTPPTLALPTGADSKPRSCRVLSPNSRLEQRRRRPACAGCLSGRRGRNYRGQRARSHTWPEPHLAVQSAAFLPGELGELRDREATNHNLNHLERSYKYNNESFVKYNFIQKPGGKKWERSSSLFQAKLFKGVLPEPGEGTPLPTQSKAGPHVRPSPALPPAECGLDTPRPGPS